MAGSTKGMKSGGKACWDDGLTGYGRH
jgi:hypothetical protein